MAFFLKTGRSDEDKAQDNAKVKAIVEASLYEIEKYGDAAILKMSKEFDNWEPDHFRISNTEIDESVLTKIKSELKKYMGYEININVSEIKRPGLRASLVGQNALRLIEKGNITNVSLSPSDLGLKDVDLDDLKNNGLCQYHLDKDACGVGVVANRTHSFYLCAHHH